MALTYVPCLNCRKTNRVAIDETQHKRAICGNCKDDLPLRGPASELSASGLMTLVQKSPLPVLAYFWAPWCAPCKTFGPTYNDAAQRLLDHVASAKVDTQANPLAADSFHIRMLPTFIVFQNGFEKSRQSGVTSADDLVNWVLRTVSIQAA